jgi:hypothetical protein
VSGTERPLLSFPPGVFALRDYATTDVSVTSLAQPWSTLERTFWNHVNASGGMLYFRAACDTSSTSWGKIASKSAREVFAAMLQAESA